jgi:uncharacterized membrane protein YbhN (UPF0104 family)
VRRSLIKLTSWLAGVGGVIAIIWYFRPAGFADTIIALGWKGLVGWAWLTLVARFLIAETTVAPLVALGYGMPRLDAFWIGWLRTFANQILPLGGVAAYAQIVRERTQISWSELAALAAPQFVLAGAALGIVGLAAIATNFDVLQSMAPVLAAAYLVVVSVAIATASGAAWFIELLPGTLPMRATRTAVSLRKLTNHPGLVAKMVTFHGVAILLRGARLWILFSGAGVTLDWQEMLLVLVISESSMLVNITPGGLGIREGFLLSGSALLGISAPIAASVAIIDRLFVVSITTLLAGPAFVVLRDKRSKTSRKRTQ